MRKYILIILSTIFLFFSCKTSKQTQYNYKDSTILKTKDSLIYKVKDSINLKTFDSSFSNSNLIIYKYDTINKISYKYLEYSNQSGNKKTKDSTIYKIKDSIKYNVKDSIVYVTEAKTELKKKDFFDFKKFAFLVIIVATLIYLLVRIQTKK